MAFHYLSPLFTPKSVAVIGASESLISVGGRVFENLVSAGFVGRIYPVNIKYDEVGGLRCFRDMVSIGERVDLAVIATPAETVPGVLDGCGSAGVRAAVVLSAGFAESGAEGKRLQSLVVETARRHGIRMLGPNCLGIVRPEIGLNATFSKTNAREGEVALVSQSGALCTAILDWADSEEIGFSAVVSTGDAADLDFGELLDFLALDPKTRSILLYIEGLNRARGFMSGLRAAARMKPVIVMKSGRYAAGVRAALSHTAALVGADHVFDAALERAGAVRVGSVGELFSAARILSTSCRARGSSLAVVTNAGGVGVIAADCATEHGIELAELKGETVENLNRLLPGHWSRGNPVDVLGDAGVDRYRSAIRVCAADAGVAAVLVMLTPQAMTDPTAIARVVIDEVRHSGGKPILACWMGGTHVVEARDLLTEAKIPAFRTPESAVAAFSHMVKRRRNQELLLEVPGPLANRSPPDVAKAKAIIKRALALGKTQLTSCQSKRVLEAFHVPMIPTIEAKSAPAAVHAAEELGFPVALKIGSPDLSHKTDAGGVLLNLQNAFEVEGAYRSLVRRIRTDFPEAEIDGVTVERMHVSRDSRELIVGVLSDPVFGPVVSFGAGGIAVEVFRDQATALPPLNEALIKSMISQTRVARLLGPFRQMPAVKSGALVEVLLRISQIVCELPEIAEMDINPLVANADGVLGLDARIVVSESICPSGNYGHMTIAPYPTHLARTIRLDDGEQVTIRPIRPEDAQIEQRFVRHLSDESKYFRFMQAVQELTPEMLVRFTQIDYDREMAFIATTNGDGGEAEIGVARYAMNSDNRSCEFAIVVADEWQGRGVAGALMGALMDEARSKGLVRIEGEVLSCNHHMLELARRLGFEVRSIPDDPSIRAIGRSL